MSAKLQIEEIITKISGKYAPYEVFSNWIQCCAISIANACTLRHGKAWEKREADYKNVISRYTEEEQESFAEMFVLLGQALTEDLTDVLGEIYMEMEMGSKSTGQFFTPFHVSEMAARLSIMSNHDKMTILDDDGVIRLHEPSCGGGSMIIAAAKALRDEGINYQRSLKVIAQDLDWKGVYMCYLQLSLLGIDAIVVQGDTLADPWNCRYPEERTLITPKRAGMLI